MESATDNGRPAILEKAWMHHAELDTYADRLSKRHLTLRKWIAILGVIATFLAIITDIYNIRCDNPSLSCELPLQATLKVLLILAPLVVSALAAYTSRDLGDGRWLAMRAGGEEIKKEIYTYRTVLSQYPDRNKWLSNRLANIQRQVYKASGSKLDTEPYKGQIPLYYSPDNANSDAGFSDLTPEEYMRFRLQDQLSWHEGRIVKLTKAKRNLTIAILLMGVAGALLAALGGSFAIWVAFTAALTAAFTGWEELRNRDQTIANYSKVKLELSIVRDFWYGLSIEEQTDSAFYKMVLATENLMFAQNSEWMRSMQEALAGVDDEDKKLVEEMVQLSATSHTELQQKLLSESQIVFAQATEQLTAVAADAASTVSGMVTAVSNEAIALNQTVEDAVDTAVAQSAATRQMIDESVDAAAAEAAASRAALESSRDAALDEAAAWRESATTSSEAALAEAAIVRQAAATAVAAETAAWSETAQETVDTAVAQSSTARQTIGESVDAVAAEAEAARQALEESRDAALSEAAHVREAAATAVAAETAAWSESAQDAVGAATAQSAAARNLAANEVTAWEESSEAALDAAAAESAAWRDTAQEAANTAAAQSTAARDAASAELDNWSDAAQEAVDLAVAESAALRAETSEQVKFAVAFTPVSEAITEIGAALTDKWTEVAYTAVADVKYPVQFTPTTDNPPVNPSDNPSINPPPDQAADTAVSNTAVSDTAVDEAVDRLLEKGVQVADDSIKQALAKAAQEGGQP